MPVQVDPNAFTNAFNAQQDRSYRNRITQQQQAQQGFANNLALRDQALQEAAAKMQRVQFDRQGAALEAQQNERKMQFLKEQGAPLAQRALASGNPQAFISAALSDPNVRSVLTANGIDPNQIDPNHPQFLQHLQGIANLSPSTPTWTDVQGPRGTLLQQNSATGEKRQVVGQMPSQPAALQRQFRTLSPEEVQRAGFPAGSVVQEDANTGQLNVVTKRDNTGSLSQKDLTTAKMKLNTVALARQQLQKVKQAFTTGTSGLGPNAFGGAQAWMPTQQGKAFDAAVDQMRSTLTALTRVPGVGAMSDYETKLDQAKFPSRGGYESVTAQKIQGLEDMLSLIEKGYTDLIGGQQPQAAPASSGVVDWSQLK
jgi:hypothetical protein